jgi:hypothetical protein
MTESSSSSAPHPKAPGERAIPGEGSGEKREHTRFRVEGATTVLGEPGLLTSLGLGLIRHPVINLSQGGAMVRVARRLPVDSRHPLRIEIPRLKEVIDTIGKVRWCGESVRRESEIYVGIRFVNLPEADRRKLAGIYELFTPGKSGE